MRHVWSAGLYLLGSPAAGPSFTCNRIKVYREFAVQNRMEGTAGFFTVALPIVMGTGSPSLSGRPVKVKF